MKYRILGIIGLLIALNGAVGLGVLVLVYDANIAEWFGPFAVNGAQAAAGGALAWWGFRRWNGPLPDGGENVARATTANGEKPKHGTVALIFAIIGGLIMVFSGGCTLIGVVSELRSSGGYFRIGVGGVLVFGGIPFIIGLVIWLLAMASRKPQPVGRANDG